MRRFAAVLPALGLAACAGLTPAPAATFDPDLQRLADRIVAAVRARDAATLVTIASGSWPLPAGDPHYCLIFDSTCIPPEFPQRHSIREWLTEAKHLRVRAYVFHRDAVAGARDGIIEIFDAAAIDEARLTSETYFCEHWGRDVFTWTFRDEGIGWRSRHPIFDYGTDVHCPPKTDN